MCDHDVTETECHVICMCLPVFLLSLYNFINSNDKKRIFNKQKILDLCRRLSLYLKYIIFLVG